MNVRARNWLWITAVIIGGIVALDVAAHVATRVWARLRPGATLVLVIDSTHPFDAANRVERIDE